MTLTMPKTDPATQRVIQLLTELSTEAPHFMQPWEHTSWMNKQVDAFLTLYKKFQGNKRVHELLTVVDCGSRTDSNVEDAVYRARKIALST